MLKYLHVYEPQRRLEPSLKRLAVIPTWRFCRCGFIYEVAYFLRNVDQVAVIKMRVTGGAINSRMTE